jgi:uncharacterized protein
MSDRKLLPGKFVWFELVSRDARPAQAFYREVLNWKVEPFPMGDAAYEMILAGDTLDTMVGGYASPKNDREPSRWLSYVSVDDVDATAKAAAANGGTVIEAPFDAPEVGRIARIADPQGVELGLVKSATGDKPDTPATHGYFLWNELHTTHPRQAIRFYETVLRFSHRSIEMGPDGTYYILSRGGVDRGGVTGHLPGGMTPLWLPYVEVDDADAAIARATNLGATIPVGPHDIPGIGRFGVLKDPTGAMLAVMKPAPMKAETEQRLVESSLSS